MKVLVNVQGADLAMAWGGDTFRVLVGFWWARRKSLHWYGVLSLLVASLTFMTFYYVTFNFVWVASIAVLAFDSHAWKLAERRMN